MKIKDIVNLTAGDLLSNPIIDAVEFTTLFLSRVSLGSLFISNSNKEIKEAIKKGAYAIIFSEVSIEIFDKEVAWIRVDDIKSATIKLIRYYLIEKDTSLYLLDRYEFSILKMILLKRLKIEFISGEWKSICEKILSSKSPILIGTDSYIFERVKPNVNRLVDEVELELLGSTFLKSTFKFEESIYFDKEIAPFHLIYLKRVLYFCKKNCISYNLEKLKYTKHFTPVYVDRFLRISRASESDRVVIFIDSIIEVKRAEEYLKKYLPWARYITLIPSNLKAHFNTIRYKNRDEAKSILKQKVYNYAFIYGLDKSVLKTENREFSLF